MKESWLDANVILRFLLDDHPEHSKRAFELIKSAGEEERILKVPPFILCEVVYVLEGLGFTAAEICERLVKFSRISGILFEPESILLEALFEYRETEADFPDVLLMAHGREADQTVWSFNTTDFENLTGPWKEP